MQAIGTYKLNVEKYNIFLTDVLNATGIRQNLILCPDVGKEGLFSALLSTTKVKRLHVDHWEAW